MAGPLNAKVILSRCSKTKNCFGVRVEQRGMDWVRTWAFPIDERKARSEGYSDSSTVTLSGEDDADFPGCPYCDSKGIVQCGCAKTGCAGGVRIYGNTAEYTCPWCGEDIGLKIADGLDVSGGGY
jgi:hypothetical protein